VGRGVNSTRMNPIELHGRQKCPFAWRTRIAAFEKGVAFEWIPFDVPSPDPRAAAHNADQKSPKLVDGDFSLIESMVIVQFLNEGYPGGALEPLDPKERAKLRVAQSQLGKIEGDVRPDQPVTDELRKKVHQGFEQLEQVLSDGRQFIGGAAPSIPDVQIWPFVSGWIAKGVAIPAALAKATAYWQRVEARPSYVRTRP
jgi:glutathione S-transferase